MLDAAALPVRGQPELPIARSEANADGSTTAYFGPQQPEQLRARDPSFRSICDDYVDAQRALKHWQAAGQAAPERVAEYRQILAELEAEALAILRTLENN